jgi:hypothetical protein
MEDKWAFLLEAEAQNVPISPFLKMDGLVVKDRNEEGGMGIHFFKNATKGTFAILAWLLVPRTLAFRFASYLSLSSSCFFRRTLDPSASAAQQRHPPCLASVQCPSQHHACHHRQ